LIKIFATASHWVRSGSSGWCAAEVGIARSQGNRLLPLQASAKAAHPLLRTSQYQYGDLVSDPHLARAKLCEALRRMDAAGGWGWPDGRSPFPGLRRFDTDLHRVFFGRSDEVAALAAHLRSPADAANIGMLLVVGPSGCGKSSQHGWRCGDQNMCSYGAYEQK
jgi:hypothetical protein